ncbi:Forkhead-associated (FHA) domain-containing protein [Trifolium repens]|nr:Forkhead-associated (FHA) domain-containing protein [Trifolium repens]
MGALSTFSSPWTPDDDLLLRNAIESDASLESLAKGAVQFSRKFSRAEIHERWHFLLYDPSEVSASMLDNKSGRSKEQKIVSDKRKPQSVRDSYYAMRKRIRRDMPTSMDCNFLVDPEDGDYLVNGDEHLPEKGVPEGSSFNHFTNHDLSSENCIPEDPTLNHFSNQDPSQYVLPENIMDIEVAIDGTTTRGFYNGVDDIIEENFPTDQNNIPQEEPQILEDNVPLNGAADELDVPIELDIDNFIRDDDLEDMSLSAFNQINHDPANLCSEFDEDCMFDSPELECGNSFDDLQLTSLPDIPDLPAWTTEEHDETPCDGSKDSITCKDGYLEELSNSLLNFNDEEELFLMDSVGKNGIGKSYYDGLSSLLLNSPIDGCSAQIPETAEGELLLTSSEDAKNPSVSCCAEVDDNAGKAETELLMTSDAHVNDPSVSCCAEVDFNSVSQSNGLEVVHKPEFQMPTSASAKDPQFPELIGGVIFCRLNTEDPDVPSNDDVFLPFNEPPPTISSSSESAARKSNKPVPSSAGRGKVLMQVEQKTSVGAHVSSRTAGACGLPGPVSGSKIKHELSNTHASHTLSRSAVIASIGLGGNNDASNKTHAALHANPEENVANASFVKHLSNNVTNLSHKKPALGNGFRNHVQHNGASLKQEQDVALPVEDNQLQIDIMGSADVLGSELVIDPQNSDEEEEDIESDDDIPYYSDIEAMILDMDLEPDDQDLYDNEEVSRYQHEETKQAIIRLELGVHSYTQRDMAKHGALALLYSRRSKFYITKTEVLLGRATEGAHVDIDLGKGGCSNLISRRQAIIKMDKDGSFYIKNVGRCLMLINEKELPTGQTQRLDSNYLIELKGKQFIFEINESRMKQ